MTNNIERIDDSEILTQSEWAGKLFNRWARSIIDGYERERFSAENRDDCIIDLVNIFIDGGVSYNTVHGYAPKLVKILVTKEGQKGMGKYKGWPEAIVRNYDLLLLEKYEDRGLPIRVEKDKSVTMTEQAELSKLPTVTYKTQPTYGDDEHLEYTDVISSWAKDRFGIVYNKELDLLAHKIGHKFNIEFQSEFFDAEWVSTGKDIPKWAVDFI